MYRKASKPFGERAIGRWRRAIHARERRYVVPGEGLHLIGSGLVLLVSGVVLGRYLPSGDGDLTMLLSWMLGGVGALLVPCGLRLRNELRVDVDQGRVILVSRRVFGTARRTMTVAEVGQPRIESIDDSPHEVLVFGPVADPARCVGPKCEEALEFLVAACAEAERIGVGRRGDGTG